MAADRFLGLESKKRDPASCQEKPQQMAP